MRRSRIITEVKEITEEPGKNKPAGGEKREGEVAKATVEEVIAISSEELKRLAVFSEDLCARVFPNESDRAFAAGFLKGIVRPVAAIHPGSGSEKKNWPIRHWAAIARWLASEMDMDVLWVGGEADGRNFEWLASEHVPGVELRQARQLPLWHLAAVLEQCAIFLGHDSGITHLAAAAGTPVVALFGPTDPAVWAPRNETVTVLRKDAALEAITPADVRTAIVNRLGKQHHRPPAR